MAKQILLAIGFAVLYSLIVGSIIGGSILLSFSFDVPGRYHRTEGICTVESGTSFDMFTILLYIMIFSISSSHQISSYFILFIYLFTYLFVPICCILSC